MIDPVGSAAQIILNDPSLAEPLFDLLIWANQPNLADDNAYDDVLDLLYLKITNCREARDKYARDRAA